MPSRRMIVAPASGSVGETTAPSANAAAHGRPSIRACATTATRVMVSRTSRTELSVIGRRLARMWLRLAKKAAP
jgi:hypothetical protein